MTDEREGALPFDAAAYADVAATAIALPLPAHCKPGVAANLARLAALAQTLTTFPLPDEADDAPR
jgi:hypothetical protein